MEKPHEFSYSDEEIEIFELAKGRALTETELRGLDCNLAITGLKAALSRLKDRFGDDISIFEHSISGSELAVVIKNDPKKSVAGVIIMLTEDGR